MRPTLYSKEQIKDVMVDRNLREVSRGSGVPYPTLRQLLAGRDSRQSTLEKLTRYIDRDEENASA